MNTRNTSASVNKVAPVGAHGDEVVLPPKRALIQYQSPDTLKQLDFGRHGAAVKLTALLITRLPIIVLSFGTLAGAYVGIAKAARWL